MDEERFEQLEEEEEHTDNSIYYSERADSEPIQFENTLGNSDEEEDSLFEESIMHASFRPRADFEEADITGLFEDAEEEEDQDLRGLFDEDAVDPIENGTTLDFEEIPDDIDIDEPIEIEKLSRIGQIMNVVVLVTTILFCLIVVGFVINAAFFIGAVFSLKFKTRSFADISGLDKNEADIKLTVLTEATNFGGFIKGRLAKPVSADVYLIEAGNFDGILKTKDAIMHVNYQPAKDIEFDFGERRLIEMEDMKMKLNPHFDASRLSGLMEARTNSRYPSKIIVRINALLDFKSFLVPFPFPINYNIEIPMHTIDKVAENLKKDKLSKFDFNPQFVRFEPHAGSGNLVLNLRQPVPKFYGPATYEISIHVPKMELNVKQFDMTEDYELVAPDIKRLFKNDSKPLVTAEIQPFVMVMSDVDPTPNILNIEAKIENKASAGLMNILSAIRDNNLNNMGFLYAPANFKPDNVPLPPPGDENSDEKFEGIPFVDFMKTFWGRQAYPASEGTAPSVPELYDPENDPAIDIKLYSINEKNKNLTMAFTVRANTHYVITQYNLPILMLSGKLPKLEFAFDVNVMELAEPKMERVALLSFEHQEKENDKEIVVKVQIQVTNLELFSKFLVKADRLYKIASLNIDREAENIYIPALDFIQGGVLSAVPTVSWPSKFASVFNLKFDFKDNLFSFVYEKSGKPVLNNSKDINETKDPKNVESNDAIIIKRLWDLFGLEEDAINDVNCPIKDAILRKVEELKQSVANDDKNNNENSSNFDKFDITNLGKQKWEPQLQTKNEINPIYSMDDSEISQLSNHRKLAKARELLKSWEDLKRAQPFDKLTSVNSVYLHLDSEEAKMKVNLVASLAMPSKKFDDHIKIQWNMFTVNFGSDSSSGGQLLNVEFNDGSLNYSLSEEQFYTEDGKNLRVNATVGPEGGLDPKPSVESWMTTLQTFHSKLLDKKRFFVPFYLRFGASNVKLKAFVPVNQLEPVAKIQIDESKVASFFEKLPKSYFDFIGYGFYRLIFNAILPNPDASPLGSVIYNVEVELPPIAAFLFTKTGDLEPECVAAINTAQHLRLWTQIVDGVLYNMYSVADGLDEQRLEIQGRIPSSKSHRIISSFDSVIELHKSYKTPYPVAISRKEDPLKKERQRSRVDNANIPNEKRFTLSTVVPVTIEFLNFAHFMKVVDEFSAGKPVQIFVGDPLAGPPTSVSRIEYHNIPQSLMNNLIGNVASKYPLPFNSPKESKPAGVEPAAQPDQAEPVNSTKDKVIFSVTADSSSPEELSLTAKISIPGPPETVSNEDEDDTPSYIPFGPSDTIEAIKTHFSFPIIRWGQTKIRFTFKKFNVDLLISRGDIKVTEDGQKILFDNLKDFEVKLLVESRSNRKLTSSEKKRAFQKIKELFRTTSIRQIFKRCLDNYNERTDYMKEYPDRIVNTTSSVYYGDAESVSARNQFHFFGAADMESLFALHGVIARKIMPRGGTTVVAKDDPAHMNFGILIKLGNNADTSGTALFNNRPNSKLPVLSLPCFFTNFCSAEQLTYSKLNERGLLRHGEHIPVNVHIRDTFQPLAASIASGFATFLKLFYMDHYPTFLEWRLIVPNEQIVGMEMNGQGMFVGKAGSLDIVKTAKIPYPVPVIPDIAGISVISDTPENYSTQAATPPPSMVEYDPDRIKFFDKAFFQQDLDYGFTDEVIIPFKAQIPDSMPELLRKTLWPIFVPMSLHPPVMFFKADDESNANAGETIRLGHTPMSIALSDSMDYMKNDGVGRKVNEKPSLLVKLFAAFIEESASTGIDVHTISSIVDANSSSSTGHDAAHTTAPQNQESKPSCSRFHYSHSLGHTNMMQNLGHLADSFLRSGDLVHVVIWSQFPWPMGTIGFDFGKAVEGKIYWPMALPDGEGGSKPVLVEGSMSKHLMIGDVARLRLDLYIPSKYLSHFLSIIQPILSDFMEHRFGSLINSYFTSLVRNFVDYKEFPLGADFIIGDNFEFKTEFIVPKAFLTSPDVSKTSGTKVSLTKLTKPRSSDSHTALGLFYESTEKYKVAAPQAVACIFTGNVNLEAVKKRQGYLWDNLDLSQTRVYYRNILTGIDLGVQVNIFLQLRSADRFAVCGLRSDVAGLAVAIEYIRPRLPFELLFNEESSSFADPPIQYVQAQFNPIGSVFFIKHAFAHTGRYKVSAALFKTGSTLKKLNYREIKFTEIYVKNVR